MGNSNRNSENSKNLLNSTRFSVNEKSMPTQYQRNFKTIDRRILMNGKTLGDNMRKVTNKNGEIKIILNDDDIENEYFKELTNNNNSSALTIETETEIYEEKEEEVQKSHPSDEDVIIE